MQNACTFDWVSEARVRVRPSSKLIRRTRRGRTLKEHNSPKMRRKKRMKYLSHRHLGRHIGSGFVESEFVYCCEFRFFWNLLRKCLWPVIAFYVRHTIVLTFAASYSVRSRAAREKECCGLSVGIEIYLKRIFRSSPTYNTTSSFALFSAVRPTAHASTWFTVRNFVRFSHSFQ